MSIENRIGADDVRSLMMHDCKKMLHKNILLNTLPATEQSFLIKDTTLVEMEEYAINTILSERKSHQTKIIIYGKNHTDKSPIIKYRQLIRLGYDERSLYIYSGGLFEWSCLQLLDRINTVKEVVAIDIHIKGKVDADAEKKEASMDVFATKERYETTYPCDNPFLYKPLSVFVHNFIS